MTRAGAASIPLVLIPALGVQQGGFDPSAWVWAGALAAWAAALGLVLGGTGRLRRDAPWGIAGAALLLWTLASTIWSAAPAQSLLEARRTLVYGAVVLALIVLARRHSARLLLAATHAAITALVLYALVRYLLGPRPVLEFEGHLLSEPLGYANAVGILAAMAVIVSVGRMTDAGSTRGRAALAALVPPLVLALELTGSDASWLALVIGLATTAALDPHRRALARSIAVVTPAALAAAALGHVSHLTSSAASPRIDGFPVLLIALACAGAAAAMHARTGRTSAVMISPASAGSARRLLVGGALALAGVGVFGVILGGATEPRVSYYHVAWHDFLAHPMLGSGAGTFGHAWLESGQVVQWGGALDAHSLYLETLAELGPVGLCLLAAFLLYPLGRAVERRTLPLAPAAAGATVAFLLHAGLDWDWELPAVVVAGLACCAAVAFAESEDAEEASPAPSLIRAAALAAALLAGAAAVAGARSATEPSAGSVTNEAPQSGASIQPGSFETDRYLPL